MEGGKLLTLFCLLTILAVTSANAPPERCVRNYKKVGCYKDRIIPNRPFPDELLNHRDPSNPNWDKHTLDWKDWPNSIHALACSCAKKTKQRNHKYFGLQFYGECWSGPSMDYARDGKSDKCIGDDYKPCVDGKETECVGKAYTNYIYTVAEEQETETKVDGGWSEWSDFTSCTASCKGGLRFRERICNNPEPQHGGALCVGEAEGLETCNTEPCQPVCKKKMEIGILLDASTSVTKANWKKTINFVNEFSKEFVMGRDGVRFGVIDFANWAHLYIDFKNPLYWSYEGFTKKFSMIEYSQGRTRTDFALQLSREKLFCSECGLREGVPKLIVVVTDGRSKYRERTKLEAEKLKEMGVNIIAMGVGNNIDKTELQNIASNNDHVVHIEGYGVINDKINQILKTACNARLA